MSESYQEQQDHKGKLKRLMCWSFAGYQNVDNRALGPHYWNITQREGRRVKTFFLIPQSSASRAPKGCPVETGVTSRSRPQRLLGQLREAVQKGAELCFRQPSGTMPVRSHLSSGGRWDLGALNLLYHVLTQIVKSLFVLFFSRLNDAILVNQSIEGTLYYNVVGVLRGLPYSTRD